MSDYLGDFTPGKTIRKRFNTHKGDGTPITLAGTPAISVYTGSTTESTAGVTLTVDYDSKTGLHDVVIDTSADGTFYAAGSDFDLVLTAGTVDSISVVGTSVATFSLANRAGLRPTTADRTLDVSATGEAGLDFDNIKDATGAHTLTNITVPTTTTLTNLPAITSNWLTAAGLASDAVAEIQSGLATQTSVDDLPTNSELATALGTADDAVLAAIAALNNLSAAGVRSALGMSSANLDTQLAAIAGYIDTEVAAILAAVDTEVAAIKAVTDKLDTTLELDSAVYRFTTNALEQAPAGGGGGSTDWTSDERTAIRTILGIPASGTTPDVPSAGALKVIDDYIDTEITGISQAVGTIATSVGLGLNAIVTAIKNKTDNLPPDPADASDIAAAFATVNSTLSTIAGYIDTEVGAIKTKTDQLTFSGGNLQAALVAAGVDGIAAESGINLRQAVALILAMAAGKISGAETTEITFKGANNNLDRILAETDEDGNRTSVTLTPPV